MGFILFQKLNFSIPNFQPIYYWQLVKANGKTGQQQGEADYGGCWCCGDKFGVCGGTAGFGISSWCTTERYCEWCAIYNVHSGND